MRNIDIQSISLQHVRPKVFADSDLSASQIWEADMRFERGKCYLVEAESGTGKSSLCSFIYGLRTDYQGQICFGDLDIRSLSVADWTDVRRSKLSILPQDLRLFPELSVLENIQIKNQLTRYKSLDQINEMLQMLELSAKAQQPVGQLSIGQQQRVAIIRALCQDFSFLLLDEPVSHLDARNNRLVASLVLSEVQERGAGLICTSVGNPLLLDSPFTSLAL